MTGIVQPENRNFQVSFQNFGTYQAKKAEIREKAEDYHACVEIRAFVFNFYKITLFLKNFTKVAYIQNSSQNSKKNS